VSLQTETGPLRETGELPFPLLNVNSKAGNPRHTALFGTHGKPALFNIGATPHQNLLPPLSCLAPDTPTPAFPANKRTFTLKMPKRPNPSRAPTP
jgi:hypothetical protein